ncbi:hypothetical protein O0L34_g5403 [Tuta absoluta]|nr:hypothetical protein O0L34_g5403 [Tuta absoluta]
MVALGARGYRDDSRGLPSLSPGLTSVRLIVNKLEAESARATASDAREIAPYNPNIDEGYDDYYDPPFDTPKGRVWYRFAVNLGVALSRCIPSVTFANFALFSLVVGFFAPRMISYLVVYPFCRLVFGTLYPAYASYKAVRTKNLKEYVKWMMYWIVFALFTCTETFTDVFLSWFPFYYEVKIVLVLWLLSPATKGSSILYRKFVHPALCRREQEIDEYIAKAKDQGYHTVLNLGTKGVNYATTVIMQTAIKGGGGLVQQIRKSYSLSDLSECEPREAGSADEADDVLSEPRLIRRSVAKSGYNTRRSASESNSRTPMYFPEVDVDVRGRPRSDEPDFSHIKSSEDISSGYSSADNSASLTRTASLSAASRAKVRTRTTVTTIKRPQAAEGEVTIEELHEDDNFDYSNMPALLNLPENPQNLYLSDSDPPFLYQLVGGQVKIIQILGSNNNPNFNNKNDNPDQWDQNETYQDASPTLDDVNTHSKENNENTETNTKINVTSTSKEPDEITSKEQIIETIKEQVKIDAADEEGDKNNNIVEDKDTNINTSGVPIEIDVKCEKKQEYEMKPDILNDTVKITSDFETGKNQNHTEPAKGETCVGNDPIDTTSLDTSNYSGESDDEASFGTPEDSPKSKRKSPKGKYGKGKAPPPPTATDKLENKDAKNTLEVPDSPVSSTSQESLVDYVKNLPSTALKDSGTHSKLQVVNPIAEKKRRHNSKSPNRVPKGSSGIGKLLQLPGKLAFWNKNDDKTKDNVSTSSGDNSRRSSTVEKAADNFQSCHDLSEFMNASNKEVADDQLSFKDADFDNISQSSEIIERSDELQKLIEAKITSHPEYKFVSLHDEVPTSKSTDV